MFRFNKRSLRSSVLPKSHLRLLAVHFTVQVCMSSLNTASYEIGGRGGRLFLHQGDITRFRGHAIVNAANERMLGGGGVDGAIHHAAGPGLYRECKAVPQVEPGVRCPTGEARITGGHNLPAKYVIHTVGPIYDSDEESAPLLASAFRSCMELANEYRIQTIAFPAISTGVYGYPKEEAAEVSLRTVAETMGNVKQVHFVLFGADMLRTFRLEAEKQFGRQPEQARAPAAEETSKADSEPTEGEEGTEEGGEGQESEMTAAQDEDEKVGASEVSAEVKEAPAGGAEDAAETDEEWQVVASEDLAGGPEPDSEVPPKEDL